MKKLMLTIAAATALGATVPALAQQTAPAGQVAIPRGVFVKGQTPGQYLARDRLIGASVQNRDGQIIGDVEDLIVSKDNVVEGVVMGTGGYFGAGEKRVGVRLGALQFTKKGDRTVIVLPAATKEVLGALQPFQRAEPKRALLDRAREKMQELTDKTKESAGPAYEKPKERAKAAYESAREQAGPAYEKAKQEAKEAYDKAKEQAGPAYEQAKQQAKEAYDKAMQAAREAYAKSTEPPPSPPTKQQ